MEVVAILVCKAPFNILTIDGKFHLLHQCERETIKMSDLGDTEALNEDGEVVLQTMGDIYCDGLVVDTGTKTSFEMIMVFLLAAFAVSLGGCSIHVQQSCEFFMV